MKFSVAAIIVYKGKYLFQKRDNKRGIFYPGLYGLFGGNNETKEFPKKTMKRELLEEIDIKFKKINHFITIKLESNQFNPKNSAIFRRHFFICKLPNKSLKKIKILEGETHKFIDINKESGKKFVPFDFAVAKYHYMFNSKKKIIPTKFLRN